VTRYYSVNTARADMGQLDLSARIAGAWLGQRNHNYIPTKNMT